MGRASKDAVLGGTDLTTKDVEWRDGETLQIRSLPAAYSLRAAARALKLRMVEGSAEPEIDVNSEELAVLKFAYGVVDPEFTEEEAQKIAQSYGPSFTRVVAEIDSISELNDEEAIAEVRRRFPGSGSDAPGDGPEVPAPASPEAG